MRKNKQYKRKESGCLPWIVIIIVILFFSYVFQSCVSTKIEYTTKKAILLNYQVKAKDKYILTLKTDYGDTIQFKYGGKMRILINTYYVIEIPGGNRVNNNQEIKARIRPFQF